MNENILPRWKVIKLIMSIRNRHYYKDNPDNAKPSGRNRNWTSTYRYNRSKMYYRHGNKNKERKKANNDWNNVITFQKQKLCRFYDIHHLWRAKEYDTLEKMNNHAFKPYDEYGIVWRIIIGIQRRKLYRYMQNNCIEQPEQDISWDVIIDKAQSRIWYLVKKSRIPQPSTDLWELNIRANREKIQRHHFILTWDYTIYENFRKFKIRYNNENKQEEI